MFHKKGKHSLITISVLGGVAISLYCGLFTLMLWYAGDFLSSKMSNVLGSMFGLILLVFSVAVSGVCVFGYPAYLVMEKKYKQAFKAVGITLLTIFIVLLIVLAIVLLV